MNRRLVAVAQLAVIGLLAGCGDDSAPPPPEAAMETLRNTALGEVVGYVAESGAEVYLGIPFAEPPIGELRWRAPRPPKPWSDTLTATEFGSACAQYGSPLGGAEGEEIGNRMGGEDCLYLNVYAPPGQDVAGLPVMLWIHGGGNTIGHAGFYDGSVLAAQENVVVVTTHYRMGPFGWFSHPAFSTGPEDLDGSGNYGTLDLIASLRWINEHIDVFGGDPGNVTIFGESAGARNVFSLMMSPIAKGLFHRAISQSGGLRETTVATAQNFTDDTEPGHTSSSNEMLLKFLIADGLASDRASARLRLADMSSDDVRSYLRNKDTWTIFEAYLEDRNMLGPNNPRVISDGLVIRQGNPLEVLSDPSQHNAVPLLAGTNRDEPKIFMAFNPEHTRRAFGLPLWPKDADLYNAEGHLGAMAWKLRGVDRPANAIAGYGGSVFAYRWDWDEQGTALGFVDLQELLGAAHGLEIPFVFGWFDLGPQTPLLFHDDNAPGRIALSDAMMSYWANFARTGDPGKGSRGELPRWQPWSTAPNGAKTLILDTDADGGIRMSSDEVTLSRIERELLALEHLSADQRCALFESTFDDQSAVWRKDNRGRYCDQ